MQAQEKNIEDIFQNEPDLEYSETDFNSSFIDTEHIQEELEVSYERISEERPQGIIGRIKRIISQQIGEGRPVPIAEKREEYITELNSIARECRSTLVEGGRAKKKISDLEERINTSLLTDKNNFLKLQEYLTRLEDATTYTREQLNSENSLEEESVLQSQLNQLEEKTEDVYKRLDQISVRIQQISVQRRQSKQYLNYAEMQSYKVQQTLDTAEYTVAFLNATSGLGEYLKAGSLAAKLHKLFDRAGELTEKTDSLLVEGLRSLSQLSLPEGPEITLEKANEEAVERMRKDRAKRIGKAKGIINAL